LPAAEFDPAPIVQALNRHEVDFVLIGGQAAILFGSARATFDIDIAYARDRQNLERLADALRELGARLRGAPDDVPLLLDAETLERGMNFTFTTRFGPLDILGEPTGAPPYAELKRAAVATEVAGSRIPAASIDHLIAMKEAAGRPQDKVDAQELRVISDELRAP
jgi:hypothetical protein